MWDRWNDRSALLCPKHVRRMEADGGVPALLYSMVCKTQTYPDGAVVAAGGEEGAVARHGQPPHLYVPWYRPQTALKCTRQTQDDEICPHAHIHTQPISNNDNKKDQPPQQLASAWWPACVRMRSKRSASQYLICLSFPPVKKQCVPGTKRRHMTLSWCARRELHVLLLG